MVNVIVASLIVYFVKLAVVPVPVGCVTAVEGTTDHDTVAPGVMPPPLSEYVPVVQKRFGPDRVGVPVVRTNCTGLEVTGDSNEPHPIACTVTVPS